MREVSSTWTLIFLQITNLSHQRWSLTQRYGIQISAHRPVQFALIFWKMNGLLHSLLEQHWSHYRHYCAAQNPMIHKMPKSHASIKQTGSFMSSQLNNGCKTMHRKKISRPKWNNLWRWVSQRMSVLRHSNAMMVTSSLHLISCLEAERYIGLKSGLCTKSKAYWRRYCVSLVA